MQQSKQIGSKKLTVYGHECRVSHIRLSEIKQDGEPRFQYDEVAIVALDMPAGQAMLFQQQFNSQSLALLTFDEIAEGKYIPTRTDGK